MDERGMNYLNFNPTIISALPCECKFLFFWLFFTFLLKINNVSLRCFWWIGLNLIEFLRYSYLNLFSLPFWFCGIFFFLKWNSCYSLVHQPALLNFAYFWEERKTALMCLDLRFFIFVLVLSMGCISTECIWFYRDTGWFCWGRWTIKETRNTFVSTTLLRWINFLWCWSYYRLIRNKLKQMNITITCLIVEKLQINPISYVNCLLCK